MNCGINTLEVKRVMLELKNISFGVENEGENKEILRDISLTIPDDKLIVVTGPNGGGKSTLAKVIMGIEKPSAGKILFNGEDITDKDITERAKMGIGFAFQQPVRFKGIQVIDLIRLATGRTIKTEEACKYLSEVGLNAQEYIEREVNSSLSGGELKRIEIASVLAKAPKLSVFDEPEAGIDLWSFQNLIKVFEGMRKHITGSSIMVISHQERILEIADEIIVIRDGSISAQGSKEEILPDLIGTTSAVMVCNEYGQWKEDEEKEDEKC